MKPTWTFNLLIFIANWVISYQVAEYYQLDMRDVDFWFNAIMFNLGSCWLIFKFRSSASIGLILTMFGCAIFHIICGTLVLSYDSLSISNQNLLHDFILFDRFAILLSICVLQASIFIVSGPHACGNPDDYAPILRSTDSS